MSSVALSLQTHPAVAQQTLSSSLSMPASSQVQGIDAAKEKANTALVDCPDAVQKHPLDAYIQEREQFSEVAKKMANLVTTHFQQRTFADIFSKVSSQHAVCKEVARQALSWKQQDAFYVNKQVANDELPSDLSALSIRYPMYIASDEILVIGPLIGTGVTRKVHVGAKISANTVQLCAMNFLKTVTTLSHEASGQIISEQLRTFQIQDRLRLLEPGLPWVTKTLYWLRAGSNANPDTVCILTELFHGCLDDCAKQLNSSAFNKILKFRSLQQISNQLLKLHQEGVVHRDLHDNNVLVRIGKGSKGHFDMQVQATLCDFETVGPVIPQISSDKTPLQIAFEEIGYLKQAPRNDGPYHPPELRKPGSDWIRDYTQAADIFALGLMALMQFDGRQFLVSTAPIERIRHALSGYGGLAELIIRALSPQTETHPSSADFERVLSESSVNAEYQEECRRLLGVLKTMSITQFTQRLLQEKKLDRYRYWNPACLTTEYIQQTLGFVPGFASIVQQALAENPQLRPSAKEFTLFFEKAEKSFQEHIDQQFGQQDKAQLSSSK